MTSNLSGDYCLVSDVDASSKTDFTPIGSTQPFIGRLNGKGHTISNLTITSANSFVGLFGLTDSAAITDLNLLNAKVTGTKATVGLLVGSDGNGGTGTIARVHVSGTATCTSSNCFVGGIIGGTNGPGSLVDSSSSAKVDGTASTVATLGGAVASLHLGRINRTYATGAVNCTAPTCFVGGLVGRAPTGAVTLSFATGPVLASNTSSSRAGGLIGLTESGSTVSRSYAAGSVQGGASGFAAGLIGQHNSGNTGAIDQTYAVGPVSSSGATTGGLIANVGLTPPITHSFWDMETSGQSLSAAGTGLTTKRLRAKLRGGFGAAWGIPETLSYPFLTNANIDFASALATLVRFDKPFIFLPISQLDRSQYLNTPQHADEADLATVFTMIARSIGIAFNDPDLIDAEIDKFFWDDATQKTSFDGPVTTYAKLGTPVPLANGAALDDTNVIGLMRNQKLVILRGTFTKNGGGSVRHRVLGTLFREDSSGTVTAVLANDPWTGRQVTIDPLSKQVIAPDDFPLANFTVDAYRPVTLLPVVTLARPARPIPGILDHVWITRRGTRAR
jgi:hypothetical protein